MKNPPTRRKRKRASTLIASAAFAQRRKQNQFGASELKLSHSDANAQDRRERETMTDQVRYDPDHTYPVSNVFLPKPIGRHYDPYYLTLNPQTQKKYLVWISHWGKDAYVDWTGDMIPPTIGRVDRAAKSRTRSRTFKIVG
jgi:hypothetical protein